jgi:hypothetical protein
VALWVRLHTNDDNGAISRVGDSLPSPVEKMKMEAQSLFGAVRPLTANWLSVIGQKPKSYVVRVGNKSRIMLGQSGPTRSSVSLSPFHASLFVA